MIYEYIAHELMAPEATAGQTERIMKDVLSLEQIPMRLYGKIADYTAKGGVICAEILAPDYVPESFHNREFLWNAVEEVEKHPKAQLA